MPALPATSTWRSASRWRTVPGRCACVKPFVRWIWFGGLLMGLGGALAALDRRYRVKVKTRVREALGLAGQGA